MKIHWFAVAVLTELAIMTPQVHGESVELLPIDQSCRTGYCSVTYLLNVTKKGKCVREIASLNLSYVDPVGGFPEDIQKGTPPKATISGDTINCCKRTLNGSVVPKEETINADAWSVGYVNRMCSH